MKTDQQLKADITAELVWDPALDATRIGVAVKDGVVTLSGTLDSYAQKHAVERALRRVAGVRGAALELQVRLAPAHQRSDTEIAEAAAHALRWHSLVPDDKVRVLVEDGRVTLTGEVDWAYQKAGAEQCVRALIGVRGVTDQIVLKPRADAADIAAQIRAALERHARREARHIQVHVDGSVATLEGEVDSMAEHAAAIGTAFATKGVSRVVDRLKVSG